mmetsp:Transcript_29646/g.64034  ORF Transcript_29646/g.64034 Transcript_29646/m.64034 type:complete len:250 (-) Transcript_29646:104-853(-)
MSPMPTRRVRVSRMWTWTGCRKGGCAPWWGWVLEDVRPRCGRCCRSTRACSGRSRTCWRRRMKTRRTSPLSMQWPNGSNKSRKGSPNCVNCVALRAQEASSHASLGCQRTRAPMMVVLRSFTHRGASCSHLPPNQRRRSDIDDWCRRRQVVAEHSKQPTPCLSTPLGHGQQQPTCRQGHPRSTRSVLARDECRSTRTTPTHRPITASAHSPDPDLCEISLPICTSTPKAAAGLRGESSLYLLGESQRTG